MKINIQNISFNKTKQTKDMLPGEIGILLKNSKVIDDESDIVILYRTNNEYEFDIINLSGLDSGFLFFDSPDSYVGILEDKELTIDISPKKNTFELNQRNRTIKKIEPQNKPDALVQGRLKVKMRDFYNFVEMSNPVCSKKIQYSKPYFNEEKNIIEIDFFVDE